MPTVRFQGRVRPKSVNLSVLSVQSITWNAPEVDLEARFHTRITSSVIDIRCDVNRFRDSDITLLHVRAFDLARTSVNLGAFAAGIGVVVELDTFIDPNGRIQRLAFIDPSLPSLSTAIVHDPTKGMPGYDEIWRLVAREPLAFFALNDLIAAITLPHFAAVNCGRALESIRRLVADDPAAERNAQWSQFNERLKVSREYREMVMGVSTAPRHGGRPDIPAQEAQEVTRRAWVIMDRYFHFLKRGKKPLPLQEFPLLEN